MPKVPYSQSTGDRTPMSQPDPTFLAMAAAEFVAESKATPPKAKAPDAPSTDPE